MITCQNHIVDKGGATETFRKEGKGMKCSSLGTGDWIYWEFFFFLIFVLIAQHVRSLFPKQGSNLGSL